MAKRVSFRRADGSRVTFTVKGTRARAKARQQRACGRRGKRIISFKAHGRVVKFCARR